MILLKAPIGFSDKHICSADMITKELKRYRLENRLKNRTLKNIGVKTVQNAGRQ